MEKIKFDNKADLVNDLSEIPVYTDENLGESFVCLADLRQKVNNKQPTGSKKCTGNELKQLGEVVRHSIQRKKNIEALKVAIEAAANTFN